MSPRAGSAPPGPSDAELLRHIATAERLGSTLAAFPMLRREQVTARLEALARALSPQPARPAELPGAPPPPQTQTLAAASPSPGGYASLSLYSDGAARGNPGPAGAGAVLVAPGGAIIERLGKFLGRQTNNVAEYTGVLIGLRRARELGARDIEVYADSQLMIRQLSGIYKVKNEGLKPLHAEALSMLRGFGKVKLVHIPREMNGEADEMSNRAIDERL